MEKVFCVGFSKTGTTSLEEALTVLGYKVCRGHYYNNHTNYLIGLYLNNDFDEIDKIISYYDAFVDMPWGGTSFYKYLSKKYPNSKFIHTQRDSEKWYQSLIRMLTKFDDNLETAMDTFHEKGRYGAVHLIKKEFNIESLYQTKDVIIAHYNKTNNQINSYFENNNFSYLSLNLVDGVGWKPLCHFLKKPMPEFQFPHVNIGQVGNSQNITSKLNRIKKFVIRLFN